MIDPKLLCMVFQSLIANQKIDAAPKAAQVFCEQATNLVESAEANDVSPFILTSIIYSESRWDPGLKSKRGACGLTQVVPRYFGVSCESMIKHPDLAIETGAFAFAFWKKAKRGDRHKALQCYSSGNKCSYPHYANTVLSLANLIKQTYERLDK